ncbi:cyclin-dependent kinase G-2 isoform X2 [Spinacia oleracea]|uniref:Cyclin-dependent kinase G-2 isoform X2 n=1 Tax=Spinacia oleracea TaxID=3562 RepID=A0ABM3QID2_SPIOL|nr:cyclin-dependent kinase G-2-like isoform X2 [Spinacia oleracea]
MLGLLPSDQFSVSVSVSKVPFHHLLASSIITGAPELLLGAKEYSTAVDMWSVVCIMAELLTNKPLFDENIEVEQIGKIFRTLGTPTDKIWPKYSQLPGVKANFVHKSSNQLHKKFPRASITGSPVLSDSGLDLPSRLLTYCVFPVGNVSVRDLIKVQTLLSWRKHSKETRIFESFLAFVSSNWLSLIC